jgi:hypothetical protein
MAFAAKLYIVKDDLLRNESSAAASAWRAERDPVAKAAARERLRAAVKKQIQCLAGDQTDWQRIAKGIAYVKSPLGM